MIKEKQYAEMECKNKRKSLIIIFSIAFFVLVVVFFWLVKNDWTKTEYKFESVMRGYTTQELTEDSTISQIVTIPVEYIEELLLDINCWSPENQNIIFVSVQVNNEKLWEGSIPYSDILVNEMTTIKIDPPLHVEGQSIMVSLKGQGEVSLWAGNTRAAGRFVVATEDNDSLRMDGDTLAGQLVMQVHGYNQLNVLPYYWPVAIVVYMLGIGVLLWSQRNAQSLLNRIYIIIRRYKYLLYQMISRDFRIKYKASIMGVLWSFLNPMLMTVVYYFVFSSVFKSSMENFVVYLMSGIILFNYFSEATSQGLLSIVNNASLINKVYIPKYIFPISKVLSSAINLGISFVPLLILMAFVEVQFTKALLLIPLLIIFLIAFSTGISMIVCSLYVFFRDMQFLWSLAMTIWMFLTPIFYPETIIPEAYIHLYHANPMYQMCAFARTIILEGHAPSPRNILLCLVSAVVALAMGHLVFHKTQNRFTLYL